MSANSVDDIGTMPTLPLLREGDRLTADEFHRRYAGMPYVKNANLVNGVVYMSPVHTQHGSAQFDIVAWLGIYCFGLRGIRGQDNTSWRIDGHNEVQPDAVLFLDAAHGGAVTNTVGLPRDTPELAVEVAVTSSRLDAGEKRDLYERTGVQEYILWRVRDDRIDWWELVAGVYQLLPADDAGVIKSRVFPGLWLDARAMVADQMGQVKIVLDAGLASQEYRAFAARLRGS